MRMARLSLPAAPLAVLKSSPIQTFADMAGKRVNLLVRGPLPPPALPLLWKGAPLSGIFPGTMRLSFVHSMQRARRRMAGARERIAAKKTNP